jgi:hypothetical protein
VKGGTTTTCGFVRGQLMTHLAFGL